MLSVSSCPSLRAHLTRLPHPTPHPRPGRPLPASPHGGGPRTEGTLLAHADPHIPFIPGFLLNFVLGVLAPYIHAQMSKVLDSSFDPAGDTEYARRVERQPEIYGLARRRIQQYASELAPAPHPELDTPAYVRKLQQQQQRRKQRGSSSSSGGGGGSRRTSSP